MEAYEKEWKELLPAVKNPWHTIDEADLQILASSIHPVEDALPQQVQPPSLGIPNPSTQSEVPAEPEKEYSRLSLMGPEIKPSASSSRNNENLLTAQTVVGGTQNHSEKFPDPQIEDAKPQTKSPPGVHKFEDSVINNARLIAQHLKIPDSNYIARLAAINMAAEENTDIQNRGRWKFLDDLQDFGAKTGLTTFDPRNLFNPGGNRFEHVMPEKWKKGNLIQKSLAQIDPLLSDVGPANISIKTAAEETGTTSTAGMAEVAKSITTHKGSAAILSTLAVKAENDLKPLMKTKPVDWQIQMITNYLREGPEAFWRRVGSRRKMSPEQINAWKKDPERFTMPDGSKPIDLDAGEIISDRMEQVKSMGQKTSQTSNHKTPQP